MAPDTQSPTNVAVSSLLIDSFDLEENLEDIVMPNLELHESLENLFTSPPKMNNERVELLSSHGSSINMIDFPTNLQSITSENDLIFSSHSHKYRDKLPTDDDNLLSIDRTPKLQRPFRTQTNTIDETWDGDVYPQNQVSDAEKRYLKLKQQLQTEELKRPDDFSVTVPLKFRLEDFDSESDVNETNNSAGVGTSSFLSELNFEKVATANNGDPFSCLEDQENINVDELDLNLLSTFDDSFAPLKTGLCLEGGTPNKQQPKSVVQKSVIEDSSEDDLIAKFQKLKVATSAYLNK